MSFRLCLSGMGGQHLGYLTFNPYPRKLGYERKTRAMSHRIVRLHRLLSVTEDPSLEFDVVIVGGGAAGIGAALGAAQSGATVCLIEMYGFLGGAATNSSVLTHCGFFDQTKEQVVRGAGQQVLEKLEQRKLYQPHTMEESGNTVVLLDMETTKIVYDELVEESGVTLFLHSRLMSAQVTDGVITSIEFAHRGGTVSVTARSFVDCSGDGALIAASSSAEVVSPIDERQASTLVMRVGQVDEDADLSIASMEAAVDAYVAKTGVKLVRRSGIAVRMPVSREIFLLLADQHRDVLDATELTRAEVESRQLAWHYFAAFRESMSGWGSSFLSATGPQLGIREARRLAGVESVTADDVSDARKRPEDAIARCGWPMEDHVEPGVTEYGGIKDKGWYHIPYGAIRSASTDNLWAGGRLVSSDNRAFASLRVMGTSLATGHACGVAAAVYAQQGRHDYQLIRQELEQQGALI